jgi:hypothetical protein
MTSLTLDLFSKNSLFRWLIMKLTFAGRQKLIGDRLPGVDQKIPVTGWRGWRIYPEIRKVGIHLIVQIHFVPGDSFSMKTDDLYEMRWVNLLETNEWIHFEMVFWLNRVAEMNVSLRNDFLMKRMNEFTSKWFLDENEWMRWINNHFGMIFWLKRVAKMKESLRNDFLSLMKMSEWDEWIHFEMVSWWRWICGWNELIFKWKRMNEFGIPLPKRFLQGSPVIFGSCLPKWNRMKTNQYKAGTLEGSVQ